MLEMSLLQLKTKTEFRIFLGLNYSALMLMAYTIQFHFLS